MLLYYSPGACSLAAHIVLEELGLAHELVRVHTGYDEHKTAAYHAVNPVGLVPERALYPSDSESAARVDETMSRLATIAHPSYRMVIRPDRVAQETRADLDELRAIGRRDFASILDHVEASLAGDGFVAGDFSIADPYLFVFWSWSRFARFDSDRWPNVSRIAVTVAAREATRRALRAESSIDEEGRPTPPDRV